MKGLQLWNGLELFLFKVVHCLGKKATNHKLEPTMYYNDSNEDVLDEIERRLPDDLDVSRDRGSITADDVIIQPDVGRGYITLTITNTETFEQEVENPRTPLDTVERAISLFENLR